MKDRLKEDRARIFNVFQSSTVRDSSHKLKHVWAGYKEENFDGEENQKQ